MLMVPEAEKMDTGSHVVVEAYSDNEKKWCFLDPDEGIIPMHIDKPINAVELQEIITKDIGGLKLITNGKGENVQWIEFVYPHLFNFRVNFDNRIDDGNLRRNKLGLVLTPIGFTAPKSLGGVYKLTNYCTHSIQTFYQKPS